MNADFVAIAVANANADAASDEDEQAIDDFDDLPHIMPLPEPVDYDAVRWRTFDLFCCYYMPMVVSITFVMLSVALIVAGVILMRRGCEDLTTRNKAGTRDFIRQWHIPTCPHDLVLDACFTDATIVATRHHVQELAVQLTYTYMDAAVNCTQFYSVKEYGVRRDALNEATPTCEPILVPRGVSVRGLPAECKPLRSTQQWRDMHTGFAMWGIGMMFMAAIVVVTSIVLVATKCK